jgi:hypothetical protein
VRVFGTVCDSASIASVVSKWRPFSFVVNWGNRRVGWVGNDKHCFWANIPWWKRKCEAVRCHDASASFVAKDRVEVFSHFHAVAVKRHSSMGNLLFGLPGRILC